MEVNFRVHFDLNDKNDQPPNKLSKDKRNARLGAQLRDNLKRRKSGRGNDVAGSGNDVAIERLESGSPESGSPRLEPPELLKVADEDAAN